LLPRLPLLPLEGESSLLVLRVFRGSITKACPPPEHKSHHV